MDKPESRRCVTLWIRTAQQLRPSLLSFWCHSKLKLKCWEIVSDCWGFSWLDVKTLQLCLLSVLNYIKEDGTQEPGEDDFKEGNKGPFTTSRQDSTASTIWDAQMAWGHQRPENFLWAVNSRSSKRFWKLGLLLCVNNDCTDCSSRPLSKWRKWVDSTGVWFGIGPRCIVCCATHRTS